MPKLLHEQGFKQLRNDVVFFGDCYGTETFPWFVLTWPKWLLPQRNSLSANLITERAFTATIENIYGWAKTRMLPWRYTIAVAEGVK